MSRSYRKPYSSFVCYTSNKKDKRLSNRRFRRIVKNLIKDSQNIDSNSIPIKLKEVSNVYNFNSDGLVTYMGYLKNTKCHNFYLKIQRK